MLSLSPNFWFFIGTRPYYIVTILDVIPSKFKKGDEIVIVNVGEIGVAQEDYGISTPFLKECIQILANAFNYETTAELNGGSIEFNKRIGG